MPLPIEGVLKHYAWGSEGAIADLLGRPPSGLPEAELWLGAHEAGPATLAVAPPGSRATQLLDWFRESPSALLSEEALARFGGRFPFLFKVLAAAQPLSLQAHPTAEQARIGYHAERAAGVDPGSDAANYKDDSHKPELLYALGPFSALSGFCPWPESERRLSLFGLGDPGGPLARPLARFAEVSAHASEAEAREAFFRSLFSLTEAELQTITDRVRQAASREGSVNPSFAALRPLADRYPSDPGLVVVLLMNHVELAPGEALFMPARKLHAYLQGVGLEVMASSDNVLRGGLTAKRIDVVELCHVLDFASDAPRVLSGVDASPEGGARVRAYPVPVSEFLLSIVTLEAPQRLFVDGPGIFLVLEGLVRTSGSSALGPMERERGQACFIAASEGVVELSGEARLALVSLPRDPVATPGRGL